MSYEKVFEKGYWYVERDGKRLDRSAFESNIDTIMEAYKRADAATAKIVAKSNMNKRFCIFCGSDQPESECGCKDAKKWMAGLRRGKNPWPTVVIQKCAECGLDLTSSDVSKDLMFVCPRCDFRDPYGQAGREVKVEEKKWWQP